MARTKIIAGNWKMNKTPNEAREFLMGLVSAVSDAKDDVIACVPFVALSAALEAVKGSNVKIGAQNLHWEEKGAFTGEISGQMLKEMGIEYVIIGHSERRQYFGETDETVNKRLHAALKYDLKPIVCVGESLTQREQGITRELVSFQTKIALKDVSAKDMQTITIAYEPIWAIGTGKTATKEQANEVCQVIRNCVKELYGSDTADVVRIQYGGSVTADNANELFGMSDIDGGLVGGASLKLADFEKIVKYNR